MLFGPAALLTPSEDIIDRISSSLHSLNTNELQSGLVRYSVKDLVPVNFLLFRISSAIVEKYPLNAFAIFVGSVTASSLLDIHDGCSKFLDFMLTTSLIPFQIFWRLFLFSVKYFL